MIPAVLDRLRTFADEDPGERDQATDALSLPNPRVVFRPWSTAPGVDTCPVPSGDAAFPAAVHFLVLGNTDHTLSDLCADLKFVPYESFDSIGVTVAPPWYLASQRFVEAIRENVADDCAEIVGEGGTGPGQAAIDACLAIAETLSNAVASRPELKYAAFVEEEGGISLVLQSNATNRRVNFRVSKSGTTLVVVTVDADGRTASTPMRLGDGKALRGWVEWLSQSR